MRADYVCVPVNVVLCVYVRVCAHGCTPADVSACLCAEGLPVSVCVLRAGPATRLRTWLVPPDLSSFGMATGPARLSLWLPPPAVAISTLSSS